MPTLHVVNIIVPALAAAPPVGYCSNAAVGMSTQPSDVAGSLHDVTLAVA